MGIFFHVYTLLYNMKDRHKRAVSATDLQGHCNLRQNSVSSASSYRVICVRLHGNLRQVTAQSASSYNVISN